MVAQSQPTPAVPPRDPVYPESDGKPMADNTKQWDAIVLIKTNLDDRLPDFVAGDHFWYPVEGRPDIVTAPDVFVAFGRPKGHRRSYKQWVEGGVAPQVVFEVLSPSNTLREMMDKALFYSEQGVEEAYFYDPDNEAGWAYVREESGRHRRVDNLDGWVSPRLGIRFDFSSGSLVIFDAEGRRFEAPGELRARAEAEAARADAEAARAEAEAARAEAAAERARRLAEKLRAAGIDPDA
ncbi:MAG: Uma2 family endonuclease [Deltaproteobacteria bacterium]|nr:Uma2 family endonuclease [Deltaproteobacteria bacterium]